MKIQKVIRHGDSLAVVIPAEMRREIGLTRGDFLKLEYISDIKKPDEGYGISIWKINRKFVKSL